MSAPGLLETYILGCIGCLPTDKELKVSRRVRQTYRQTGEWKAVLAGILHFDEGTAELMRQKWETYQKEAALRGAPADPLDFVRAAIDDECFAKFTRRYQPPSILPQEPWGPTITIKAVGYWRDTDGSYPKYPWPQTLVRRGWYGQELKKILAYLRSGYDAHPNFAFGGWSSCRFKNCVKGEHNGSGDATDGVWGWPDGLAHYVECHDVRLPAEFVETMRAHGWNPPQPEKPHLTHLDYAFWIDWGNRNSSGRGSIITGKLGAMVQKIKNGQL